MNMGFWVPEANFYRQSSFLVSCQIIAQTSSQLCPGHSKADVAKHRIWGWGRDNISEGLSEVYITYIFYCCELSWGCALPTDVCTHLIPVSKNGKLTFERIYWTLREYRSSSTYRARSRTGRELKTRKPVLGWKRKEVNGQPQIYLTSQFNPVWTARTKFLFWGTSAVQMFPSRQPLLDNEGNHEQND